MTADSDEKAGVRGGRVTLFVLDTSGPTIKFKPVCDIEQRLMRRAQKTSPGTWAIWAALIAFALGWVALQTKRSVDEVSAGNFSSPSQLAFCANPRNCVR